MRPISAGLLAALILSASAALGGNDATRPTKAKATALVRAVLKTNAQPCGLRVVRITATLAKGQWRVVSITSGRTSGTSRWTIDGREVRAGNALARRIRDGCPASEPPAPPQAPVEPPLTGPGAPATFTFGPELPPAEQARVRRGLDAGARYYRAILGRELPSFSAWAYRDIEALLGAYVQNEPISSDDARRLMDGGSGRARYAAEGVARTAMVPERGGQRPEDRSARSVSSSPVRGRRAEIHERVHARRDSAGRAVVAC